MPADIEAVERIKPNYVEFEGWTEDIDGATSLDDLPAAARKYIEFIEEQVGVKIAIVSTGPERNQNIILVELLK